MNKYEVGKFRCEPIAGVIDKNGMEWEVRKFRCEPITVVIDENGTEWYHTTDIAYHCGRLNTGSYVRKHIPDAFKCKLTRRARRSGEPNGSLTNHHWFVDKTGADLFIDWLIPFGNYKWKDFYTAMKEWIHGKV